MLTAHQLTKYYGVELIFKDVSFSINAADRVGLIGPNGCGKTTLLRVLAGEEPADSGRVAFTPGDLRVGYLPQGFEPEPGQTLGDAIGAAAGDPAVLEQELTRLGSALAEDPENDALQVAYDRVLHRLSTHDPARIETILSDFGLDQIQLDHPVAALSGGQKTRLALALVLLGEPQLLLLDEPTNHLDIAVLEWLEGWLADFPGAALIVSHDRTFLDRTANRILYLDPESHTTRDYTGNFSDYLEQSLSEREKQLGAYRDQVYDIRRMRQDIARTKEQARATERGTKNDAIRRYAKKVARKAKTREKKLERYLESAERVEKPKQSWQMKLELDEAAPLGQDVLMMEDLSVGFPGHKALLSHLNGTIQNGERVVLTGPNGSGKSTLLRTIAGGLPPLAGRYRLGASVKLGYMAQEQELLDPALSALQTIQQAAPLNETEARSFLHYFLFSGDDSLRPIGHLSFGERARLSLARLVAAGCNFLLLDEPINHLDIPSRTSFERALAQFEGAILVVVHDRYFIERFATEVWAVEASKLRVTVR